MRPQERPETRRTARASARRAGDTRAPADATPAAGPAGAAAVAEARAAARAGTLAVVRALPLALPELAEAAGACRACHLYRDATQTVFGEGPAAAAMMLVGEQPGDEEDRAGHPFVGPAGRVLDDMLVAAGVSRDQVYVTNAVKHFKFELKGKRRLHQKPKSPEIRACHPWLESELERLRPDVVVALGATASAALYGGAVSVVRDRGRPLASPRASHCFVTYHPSAALRAPSSEERARIRAAIIADLIAAARHLPSRRARAR